MSRPDPQAALKAAIQAVFVQAKGRYGHRRIQSALVDAGWRVAKKTVLACMRHLGVRCQVRRRRYTSSRGEVGIIAPNVLDRDVAARVPNQNWVTDVTEVRVGEQKVDVAPVMDLFDRQIIASTVGPSPTLTRTNTALERALATLDAGQQPLIHSDQGFQDQHVSWQRFLAAAGATPSMSRKGKCLDTAVLENVFGHLKEALFHHTRYADIDTLVAAIHEYMRWYTTERISTQLNGVSPVQDRTHALAA